MCVYELMESICQAVEAIIYKRTGLRVFIYGNYDYCNQTIMLNVFDFITTKLICDFRVDEMDLYRRGIADTKIIADYIGDIICEKIKPKAIKPPIGKLRPVPICECCGGKIDFNTLTCKYCGREYYIEDVAPPVEKVESSARFL